ncbi:MAG TPA: phosphate regulon sensor histidine kinase PhoR [Arenimonas sp.]|nr:phosphate regulon sensor histidine kinase PhoR [Arenimonas sp.]
MQNFIRTISEHQTLRRILLFIIVAGLIGWAFGYFMPALIIACMLVIIWQYWRVNHLLMRAKANETFGNTVSKDIYQQLENHLAHRELSARQRARRLLGLLRAYRQAGAALHDGGLIVQRNSSQIVWFNKAAKRFLGLSYPRSLGTNLLMHINSTRVHEWFLAGDIDEPLMDLPCPQDENIRLSLRLLPYSNEQFMVVVRDVTKLMQLEHMRRDFVANVSHELRTPLTVVHGYLDMMEPEDNPEFAPMIEEMRKQSARMAQLVEDLLTLSRLDAEDSLREEVIPMQMMLTTLRREAEALSQGHHKISIEDSAQCDIYGAHKELHSAFSNLVSNAVRYTPYGGTISIRFEQAADKSLRLSVKDSGYGIPAQHLPRITERFYRVSTSRSRESGGTGLGLSIAKHVLSLHQARLEIESEVGKGSQFTCIFSGDRARSRPR